MFWDVQKSRRNNTASNLSTAPCLPVFVLEGGVTVTTGDFVRLARRGDRLSKLGINKPPLILLNVDC